MMTAQYNLERSKLDASKAEVVSAIEGAKSRIDVGVSEGDLKVVNTVIGAHKTTQKSDIDRLDNARAKRSGTWTVRRAICRRWCCGRRRTGSSTCCRTSGLRARFGSAPPPFKEGDQAWTGASIAEIPDLSQMRIELKLEEVDRGRLKLGQTVPCARGRASRTAS